MLAYMYLVKSNMWVFLGLGHKAHYVNCSLLDV